MLTAAQDSSESWVANYRRVKLFIILDSCSPTLHLPSCHQNLS